MIQPFEKEIQLAIHKHADVLLSRDVPRVHHALQAIVTTGFETLRRADTDELDAKLMTIEAAASQLRSLPVPAHEDEYFGRCLIALRRWYIPDTDPDDENHLITRHFVVRAGRSLAIANLRIGCEMAAAAPAVADAVTDIDTPDDDIEPACRAPKQTLSGEEVIKTVTVLQRKWSDPQPRVKDLLTAAGVDHQVYYGILRAGKGHQDHPAYLRLKRLSDLQMHPCELARVRHS